MEKRTTNPAKAQVRSIRALVSDSHNKFMIILMNWSNIVGKGNSKIMMPLELKQKTLCIAVPNNIVLAATSKFSALIIKKADQCIGEESVEKLKFSIDPARFKKTKAEKTKTFSKTSKFDEEEIIQKKQELMHEFHLDENIAEYAAGIELSSVKRG